MHRREFVCWLLVIQLALPLTLNGQTPETEPTADAETARPIPEGFRTSEALLEALQPATLRTLVAEVLERNPDVARQRQWAAAMAVRAPQVRALPDPVAALTLFVLPPETRVGPQRLSASVSQKLPWFGKLALDEQAALYAAAAAEADVEAKRLAVMTETRRLFYELAFLDEHESIVQAERATLDRFEEAARARYSAGAGLQQEIVRIQAQITRIDARLLEIDERRVTVLAALNALRDRPSGDPVEGVALPAAVNVKLDRERLRQSALNRPELAAADARIAERKTRVERAHKDFRPDFTVGLGYTVVDRRQDAAGRASPPPDDGDDILALTGAVNLPIRKRKLEASLEEQLAMQRAAGEDKRRISASIERSIGDFSARLPLLFEHWQLLDTVLLIQAREALRSAESAYATGKINAVDLLDAEVVLFEVRTAAARTLTDWAVTRAELESSIAGTLIPSAEDLSLETSDHD